MKKIFIIVALGCLFHFASNGQDCYHAIYKMISSKSTIPENIPMEMRLKLQKEMSGENIIQSYSSGDSLVIFPPEKKDSRGKILNTLQPVLFIDFKEKVGYRYFPDDKVYVKTDLPADLFVIDSIDVEYNGIKVNTAFSRVQNDIRIKYKPGYPLAMPYPIGVINGTILEFSGGNSLNYQLQKLTKESGGCPFPDIKEFKLLSDDQFQDYYNNKMSN